MSTRLAGWLWMSWMVLLTFLIVASVGLAQTGSSAPAPAGGPTAVAGAELPGDSLYRLAITLETAEGVRVPFDSLRGKPLLITMFYSRCPSVCPLLTAELQNIDRNLTPEARNNVRVLMVSFDAVRDTPAALKSFEQLHHIDDPRWIVARVQARDVRALAAVLGIRYRELPDHSFNHSEVITLADENGVVKARAVGIRAVDESFLDVLRATVGSTAASPQAGE